MRLRAVCLVTVERNLAQNLLLMQTTTCSLAACECKFGRRKDANRANLQLSTRREARFRVAKTTIRQLQMQTQDYFCVFSKLLCSAKIGGTKDTRLVFLCLFGANTNTKSTRKVALSCLGRQLAVGKANVDSIACLCWPRRANRAELARLAPKRASLGARRESPASRGRRLTSDVELRRLLATRLDEARSSRLPIGNSQQQQQTASAEFKSRPSASASCVVFTSASGRRLKASA